MLKIISPALEDLSNALKELLCDCPLYESSMANQARSTSATVQA